MELRSILMVMAPLLPRCFPFLASSVVVIEGGRMHVSLDVLFWSPVSCQPLAPLGVEYELCRSLLFRRLIIVEGYGGAWRAWRRTDRGIKKYGWSMKCVER